MLQQMGYMSNVLGGFGTAIQKSPRLFEKILRQSDRLNRITRAALTAHSRSDIKVTNDYFTLVDPDYWTDRLEGEKSEHIKDLSRALSKVMENTFDYSDINVAIRRLRRDASLMDKALKKIDYIANFSEKPGETFYLLHELRLSLIQFIYLKTTLIPRFSSRTDVSLEELNRRLLALDIPDTLSKLREIFPYHPPENQDAKFGEISSYNSHNMTGYNLEEEEIFAPIETAYKLILTISGLLAVENEAIG